MTETGFNPNKSKISENTLVNFIDNDVSGQLMDVPGVGKVAVECFKKCGIENTFQLFGKFLLLKKKDMTEQEHCDAMWEWLKSIGVNSHRSGIIRALGLKLSVPYPNLFGDDIFAIEDTTAEITKEDASLLN